MDTDKPLLKVFQSHAAWLYELSQVPVPVGKCEVKSVALKALQRTADVVAFPADLESPILAVEFQMKALEFVIQRSVMEVAQLEIDHSPRAVIGVIIVNSEKAKAALNASHWASSIKVETLANALKLLPADHPVRIALSPLVEKNERKLAKQAAQSYQSLRRSSHLSKSQRTLLCEVFYRFIVQRFKNQSDKEIKAMFEFIDLKETRAGRDVYNEGIAKGLTKGISQGISQGMTKGMTQGISQGMTQGMTQGLSQGLIRTTTRLATRKFGPLPRSFASSVQAYTNKQLDALADAILDLPDAKALAVWLKKHPARKPPARTTARKLATPSPTHPARAQ